MMPLVRDSNECGHRPRTLIALVFVTSVYLIRFMNWTNSVDCSAKAHKIEE